MPRRTPLEVFINAQTDRQAAYEKRKRAAGFTKVNLWVPVECVDRIKELARAMVDEKERAQADASLDVR